LYNIITPPRHTFSAVGHTLYHYPDLLTLVGLVRIRMSALIFFHVLTGMGRLKNLIFLELSGNRIRNFPETLIQGLVSLQELAMDQNPICRIPRNLSHLQQLRYLSVCEGNLSFLPAVPFHGFQIPDSEHGDQQHQSTSNYRRSTPQFRFDGNPKLNYLPFWIPQYLGPDIECFG